jgi:two-component system response regulator PilR (NtrC family)
MKQGAYDYVTKPFQVDELRLVLEKALEKKLLTDENARLRGELTRNRSLVGTSPAMQHVYDLMSQVATTKTNVLLSGESGTGKELAARGIHEQSGRAAGAFVAVNCGAIPENLLESELFGHVKGAFTGAVADKDGLFEVADGGTLFLDEIGELPHGLQVKLLRVLQEKTVRRVGGNRDEAVDVRIIAATNRDLHVEAMEGRFREDLYYRLNVIQIPLPPLRVRREDIPLLVQHFVEKYATDLDKSIAGISDEAMEKILQHDFPGNVRELENTIERAVALTRSETIPADVLPAAILRPEPRGSVSLLPAEGAQLDEILADYERGLIREALSRTAGVKKRAAKLLGVTFRSFRYRLDKLGIERDDATDG